MKKILLFLLMSVCWCIWGAPVFSVNEKSTVNIIIPDNALETERHAAAELALYLPKLTNCKCKTVTENSADKTVPAFYIGKTAFAILNGIDFSKLDREEWILKSVNNKLILCGGEPRGTIYAVYEFLEKNGVVWPDEVTEYVPFHKEITINKINEQSKPAFRFRNITNGFSRLTTPTRLFMVRLRRNNYNINPAKYGSGEHFGGCHTFHSYTSKEWPDKWFSMNAAGKRIRSINGGGPGQFCLTDPEVRQAVKKALRKKIAADRKKYPAASWPMIYDISQNDNMIYCVCPTCKAARTKYKNYSGVLLEFINDIAGDIAKDYPELMLQTFAYAFTLTPPENIVPAPNVMIRICKLGYEFYPHGLADTLFPNSNERNKRYLAEFKKWSSISKQIAIWDYWILYSPTVDFPYLNIKAVDEDINFYKENKVNNLFVECENTVASSFSQFKFWFGHKKMVDPKQDFNTLADIFCRAYYGKAAVQMRKYMDYLSQRTTSCNVALAKCGIFAIPYLDREFFETVNALLDEAEDAAADDKNALKHIGYERAVVDLALLHLKNKFKDSLPTGKKLAGSIEKLFYRYKTNFMNRVRFYYGNSNVYTPDMNIVNTNEKVLEAKKSIFINNSADKLPPEFANRKVIDVNWSFVRTIKDIVTDKEGAFSHAIKLRTENTPRYHRIPFEMAVFDRFNNRNIVHKKLTLQDIPQNEKYNLLHLGRVNIKNGMRLWCHWSWYIQFPLDVAVENNGDNKYDIYVSIKFKGAPYVKDSKSPAAIFVDRIYLVK